jgi:hypothetical protein
MKKRTTLEQAQHDLRERLIKYYGSRKGDGDVQRNMAREIPCSIGTLSAFLQRQRPIRGMSAIAIEKYLDRMDA